MFHPDNLQDSSPWIDVIVAEAHSVCGCGWCHDYCKADLVS